MKKRNCYVYFLYNSDDTLLCSNIQKKGKETMTDVWRLPEKYPDFTTYLNKVLDRKKRNAKDSAKYYFTDGAYIIIS